MAYASLAEIKLYRGIEASNTRDDTLLEALLARAQRCIEIYTERVFEAASTASTRYFDAVRDISADKRSLYLDEDLAEIQAVQNGDGETVSASDYVTEPRNQGPYWAIKLKTGTGTVWTYEDSPEDAIEVQGKWAYALSAPADIVQATIRLANSLYPCHNTCPSQPGSIPGWLEILCKASWRPRIAQS